MLRAADSDIEINNYCHNGAKCPKWMSNILFSRESVLIKTLNHV